MKNNFEIHRFVLPMFLHGDLGHLVANVVAQLMIGSSLEPDIGSLVIMTIEMVKWFWF